MGLDSGVGLHAGAIPGSAGGVGPKRQAGHSRLFHITFAQA